MLSSGLELSVLLADPSPMFGQTVPGLAKIPHQEGTHAVGT